MQGFPEMPDGLRTNRSLMQMRPKYRGFATSDPRTGVNLTEKGEAEARRVTERLGVPECNGKPIEDQRPEIDPRRPCKGKERTRSPAELMEDIRARILYRRFCEGKLAEADVVHLLGLVGLYDHTLPSELRKAFGDLRKDAEEVGDSEIIRFLEAVRERFAGYLNRPDPRRRQAMPSGKK
jgi:hypothetical protein